MANDGHSWQLYVSMTDSGYLSLLLAILELWSFFVWRPSSHNASAEFQNTTLIISLVGKIRHAHAERKICNLVVCANFPRVADLIHAHAKPKVTKVKFRMRGKFRHHRCEI